MKGQNRSIRSPAGYSMFDGIRQAPPHLRTNRPSLSDTHLWLVLAREGSPVLDHSHVSHVFLLYPTPTPTQDMISVQCLCVHGLMNFLGTPTPDLCVQMSQVWVRLNAQMSQKWSEKWVRRVKSECVDEFLTDLFKKKTCLVVLESPAIFCNLTCDDPKWSQVTTTAGCFPASRTDGPVSKSGFLSALPTQWFPPGTNCKTMQNLQTQNAVFGPSRKFQEILFDFGSLGEASDFWMHDHAIHASPKNLKLRPVGSWGTIASRWWRIKCKAAMPACQKAFQTQTLLQKPRIFSKDLGVGIWKLWISLDMFLFKGNWPKIQSSSQVGDGRTIVCPLLQLGITLTAAVSEETLPEPSPGKKSRCKANESLQNPSADLSTPCLDPETWCRSPKIALYSNIQLENPIIHPPLSQVQILPGLSLICHY